MINTYNVYGNGNAELINELGGFKVIEHTKDLSVSSAEAVNEYFAAKMNVRRRQVMINLANSGCIMQKGAMQWISGNINVSTGVTGVGNFIGKAVKGKVTGESAVKPEYRGTGTIMLEPTYKHILLINVASWGGIVLEDGLFLACDDTLTHSIVSRSNLSSAVLGGEGLFNLCVSGQGVLACESPVPMEELIEVVLDNDVMKIDGSMAVAWSSSLEFTVEKSTKSLIGSAISGEGFVNVYRGSGKILMAPTAATFNTGSPSDSDSSKSESTAKVQSQPQTQGSSVMSKINTISNVMDFFN
jgi:uncharacterized protein (AIM24 family)